MKKGAVKGAAIFIAVNLVLLGLVLFWPAPSVPPVDIEPRFEGPWRLPSRPVKIATFNLGFGKRLDEAIEILRREEPDIVCLQEILSGQVERVEAGLGMACAWEEKTNQNGVPCGNAVLARGRVSSGQSFPNPHGGSYGLWAVVEIEGSRFLAASIHLFDLKSPRAGYPMREREIRALQDAVEKVGAPLLMAGDFNHPPTSVNYRLLTERFTDLGRGSGATHASRVPVLRVDYVFGTGEWEEVSSKSIKTTVSDHYPVVAVVRARTRNPE